MSKTITNFEEHKIFRLSAAMKRDIAKAAHLTGQTDSQYIRTAVAKALRADLNPKRP